ncbi:DUF4347 domain-containing protein [Neptunomonas japonica]|uniref:Dystroglycan-type cadherin-like domain-containing protein n=1 Tax=Neptunomonas japonica JAMM 1380 TaxID=1441457 RepID=A0A7R6SW01_9GAMM|nr:DUF4347 domain-containing protein [Neptunomonas japonica]BBB30134.1 hypothetical protein NEJAP_2186 [Neptunomonas japonica JAMM 1380]
MAGADNLRNKKAMQESYILELLEPRIMLSADPFGAAEVAVDLLLGEQDEVAYKVIAPAIAPSTELEPLDIASVTTLFASQDLLSDSLYSNLQPEDGAFVSVFENETARIELIIIDSAVSNQQQLLQQIIPPDSHVNYQIHYLDQDSEGINQISELLNQYSQVDAVHILSHGKSDGVQLGSAWVNTETLNQQAEQITQWSSILTDDADILLYGCDVTSSEAGMNFVQALQRLTGADIAASDDKTGAQSLGGDWDLEYQVGQVESVTFSANSTQQWNGLLDIFTVDDDADTIDVNPGDGNALDASGNTTLRAAIMEANAQGGSHTINLDADTYTLTIGGKGDAFAATGDLDITANITLSGAGVAQTTINAAGVDRIFDLQASGSLNVSGIKLQGGEVTTGGVPEGGGALRIVADATVTASDVEFSGNAAENGGAISNAGTLNLYDSTIDNNSATQQGGGIDTTGTTTLERVTVSNNTNSGTKGGGIMVGNGGLTATNLTVSGNSSASDGGGIYTLRPITLISATITDNTATWGSGIYTQGAGSVDLSNTIVAGNNTSSDLYGTFVSSNNNLIGNVGTATGLTDGVSGDQVGSAGSPIDPLLSTLQDNGGPTLTHALLAGSTAIDTGNGAAPATDQRGITRPQDGDGDAVATADIGAFEFELAKVISSDGQGSAKATAMDASGNYVVVWSQQNSDSDGWGVFAQRFDIAGTAQGTEIQINQTTADDQRWASVGMRSSGEFVVSWNSSNQDGSASSIYARQFNADGTAAGSEFRVNTQMGAQTNASLDVDSTGNFIVVWQGNGPADSNGVFFRRFDAAGTAVDASEIIAHTATDGTTSEFDPVVAWQTGGKFVVAWEQDDNKVYFQRFDNTGAMLGAKTQIDSLFSNSSGLSIDANSSGDFVFAYRDEVLSGAIYARAYYEDGSSAYTNGNLTIWAKLTDAQNPTVAMQDSGDVLVAYQTTLAGGDIHLQRINADGSLQGSATAFVTDVGDQSMPALAMLDLSNYALAWNDTSNANVATLVFNNTADLWLSTNGNASYDGAVTWGSNDIVAFGNPDLNLELENGISANTDGTFNVEFSLPQNVRAMHYVNSVVTVDTNTIAGGLGTYELQPGQIVLSMRAGSDFTVPTLAGGTLTVNNTDVLVYTSSTGIYEMLLEDAIKKPDTNAANIHAITIVEQETTIGVDTTLAAGTYLIARSDPAVHSDISTYDNTNGRQDLLLGGNFLSDTEHIQGLELLEAELIVGGTTLAQGTLLISINTDMTVGTSGSNTVSGEKEDIIALTVKATEQDSAPDTDVDAQILFDGSDVSLVVAGDTEINGLTLMGNNLEPINNDPTLNNALIDQNTTQDTAFSYTFAAGSFGDVDVSDTLTYSATLSSGAALPSWLTFDNATRTFSGTPLNADVGTLTVDVIADDGNGGTPATDGFSLVITNTNDLPGGSITIASDGSPAENVVLSVIDTLTDEDGLGTITYHWLRNGTDIGSTGSTYTLVDVDIGQTITVEARYIDMSGVAERLSSVPLHVDVTPIEIIPTVVVSATAPVLSESVEDPEAEEVVEDVISDIETVVAPAVKVVAVTPEELEAFVEPEIPNFTIEDVKPNQVIKPLALAIGNQTSIVTDLKANWAQLSDPLLLVNSSGFMDGLDEAEKAFQKQMSLDQMVVGSGIAMSTGLSIGYVTWLIRSGVLLSSVLTSLPAWRFVDPLPILSKMDGADLYDDEEDSLEELVQKEAAEDESMSKDP